MSETDCQVTQSARDRVESIRREKGREDLNLRVAVEGGGCAGFKYIFSWDNRREEGDRLFAESVVVDAVSLPFLEGATVDYVVTLMGENFRIVNPNASSGCGCGNSFGV